MDVGGSIKRIKVEHSYAYSNESPGQYTDAGDPEEDPLLISPEDVKVEINHDFVLKTEEPDEYSYGVEENVTKFETSMVTDEPVETNFDNCYEQKTSEEVVCKTEVEETVECSKNFSNQVVSTASNPFALTNCFAQVIPNTIVIPNFSQLESHNESVKRSLEDLKNTNSRLTSKADKLTAANLKIKLELKALKKENAALKKEKYNALSKSETGQLDVKKLELELRCSKNRETLLEKKVSMLRTQVMRKPVSDIDSSAGMSTLNNFLKQQIIEKDILIQKQFEQNKKYLAQEAKLIEVEQMNLQLKKKNNCLEAQLVSTEQASKQKLRKTLVAFFEKERDYKNALQQIQTMQKTLKSNYEKQANHREELRKEREGVLERNSMYNLKMLNLQKELAKMRKSIETFKTFDIYKVDERSMDECKKRMKELIDVLSSWKFEYKGCMKPLKTELARWKAMYKQEKSRRLKAENLYGPVNSLNIEMQETKEDHKKKVEESILLKSLKCQYCGF